MRETVNPMIFVGGGSEALPPPPGPNMVWGVDALGVPGWVSRYHYVGATLWPTSDHTLTAVEPTGEGIVQLRDADEIGQQFFDPADPDKVQIKEDGIYIVSFSVSMLGTSNGTYRVRIFSSTSPLVYDLTGRQSVYTITSQTGSVDLTGTSGLLRLPAGSTLRLMAVAPGTGTVRSPARATFINIQRIG